MGILEKIDSPDDVKTLSRSELPQLAEEIRQEIIKTVSVNGGHLASSLGAVEITIALLYVFDLPHDKLIWDVGHQAYAHKLLTGRRAEFKTLRQRDGISGFPHRTESPYDAFTTGHSSTSISAGLGMASALKLGNNPAKTIAVIGDGSLTGGIAYEGLNQAGDSDKNILVILNDNDMSISRNVGALSSFLSRTFSSKYLQDLRNQFGEFLKKLPKIGEDVYQFAKRSEESFKAFVTPGMLFEAFNFDYFGPINGHKLDHLIDILENIKKLDEPVLLHITTQKGKGYRLAEKNPTFFHGVAPFDIETGELKAPKSNIPSYTGVFGKTIIELAEKDDKITAITAAMPEGTGLEKFSKTFPERFYDVGIAEQHAVTFAAGMAAEGYKPVVSIYSTFLQRSYDQILHDVCLDALPVTFAIDRGGVVGEDGPTHHGLFDYSYLRSMPNMIVMAPSNENELRQMMQTAIEYNGPAAFRYPRGNGTGAKTDEFPKALPVGKAEVMSEGTDIAVIAIGRCVNDALEASKILADKGISVTVINARFVKPLDSDLICRICTEIPKVITVEEHVLQGGFGSAVLECLSDSGVNVSLKRLGIDDCFVEHATQAELRSNHGISTDAIVIAAEELMR